MRAEFQPEKGRYLVYRGGEDYLFENPLWDGVAKLLDTIWPHHTLIMGMPYDYGRSVDFAVAETMRKDGRPKKKEIYLYVVRCEVVRNDLK